jgi:short-subunit dehydrogenase
MMEVNYLGSVHVARAFVPELRAASARSGGDATLLLIASVAGLRGFPELAGYSASKFAVIGFAQALKDELHRTGVDVRVLCPPPGDTPMVQKLDRLPPIYELSRMFTAEEVARGAFAGLESDDFLLLIDAKSKLLHGVMRAAPRLLDLVVHRTTKRRAR